jgi:pSer/pThr/pTyr-binding forkhead associated (FHA) protein
MSKYVTRTFIVTLATVEEVSIDLSSEKITVVNTYPIETDGELSDEQLIRKAKSALGLKRNAMLRVKEKEYISLLYRMPVEDFLKHAELVSEPIGDKGLAEYFSDKDVNVEDHFSGQAADLD